MSKPSLEYAVFDAVLARAFTDAVTEELCTMEQVCPRNVHLSGKYRKIERKAYRKWEKENGETEVFRWIQPLRRVAVWVLIAGILGLTLVFAVPTVRAGFCNLVVSVYEKYISFEGRREPVYTSYAADGYDFEYIPVDYEMVEHDDFIGHTYRFQCAYNDSYFIVSYYPENASSIHHDTDQTEITQYTIQGYTAYLIQPAECNWDELLWNDGNCIFSIIGDIPVQTILRIAENIIKVIDPTADDPIENYHLYNYTGDDPVAAIPEEATEIGAYAFADAAVPVERIEIPASVERIHPQAFMGLPSLKEVTVAEDNKAFRVAEQYLIAADGSIVFAFCDELWGNSGGTDPFEAVNSVDAQKFCEDGFRLVFHDAVLYFREPDERDLTDGYDSMYCPLYRIEGFGHSADLEDVRFPGNHRCSLYTAEDRIIFTDYEAGGMGDTYIFSEGGIWEQHNSASLTAENYNDTICSFQRTEDGQLTYWCSPRKYLLTYLSLGELLPYCVSRDELWRIYGSVEFDGTEAVFTVEKAVRVGEQFDEERLEAERAMHHKMMSYTAEPEWETLDELFVYNAERYEEWLGE